MRKRSVAVVTGVVLLLLAGCSSDQVAEVDRGETDGAAVAAAQDAVVAAMAPRTAEDSKLPEAGPKAATGISMVAITCAAAIEGCRAVSDAHIEAAEAMGWSTTLIDGGGSPQGWNEAMESAIALQPDVIALGAILPEAIQGSLQTAKDAGIITVCTQCGGSGDAQKLIDVSTGDDVNAAIGTALGNYIVAGSEGSADVLMWYYPEFGISKVRFDAAKTVIDGCSGCSTETFEVKISEWGTSLPGRIQSLIQQNPSINWMYSPADETAIDAMNAVEAAGASGSIFVVGGNGNIQALETIATSPVYIATAAVSYAASSWAGIDGANRLLNGEAPVETTSSVRVFDQTNVDEIVEGEYYSGDVDFRAVYRSIWGV